MKKNEHVSLLSIRVMVKTKILPPEQKKNKKQKSKIQNILQKNVQQIFETMFMKIFQWKKQFFKNLTTKNNWTFLKRNLSPLCCTKK